MRRADAPGRSQCLDLLDQLQIAIEVFALKPWGEATVVIGREIVRGAQFTGQKPPAERAVRHEGNAQTAAGGKHVILFRIA